MMKYVGFKGADQVYGDHKSAARAAEEAKKITENDFAEFYREHWFSVMIFRTKPNGMIRLHFVAITADTAAEAAEIGLALGRMYKFESLTVTVYGIDRKWRLNSSPLAIRDAGTQRKAA